MTADSSVSSAPRASYASAGVDIDRATDGLRRLKPLAAATHSPAVLTGLGLFAGFYRLPVERYQRPVLVNSIDGVGTKLALADTPARWEGIGYDLVSHCVNDITVHGAEPLTFLDYYAQGRLDPETLEAVARGLSRACIESGCALIGGETAEMPGLYQGADFDLAGAITGIVEEDRIIRGIGVTAGDVVLGLPSIGLHTNGFSLARRVLLGSEAARGEATARLGADPVDVLLAPHPMYLRPLRALWTALPVKALAHITGGGLLDNVPRVLPPGTAVRIDRASWTPLPVFETIAALGRVEEAELFRTFNMGVGMIAVVDAAHADEAVRVLRAAGTQAWICGEVVAGDGDVRLH